MLRPRRGKRELEICCGVRPGLRADNIAPVMVDPGTKPPVVTFAGTVVGRAKKLAPNVSQLAAGHCAAVSGPGEPHPALPSSQPLVKILFCAAATPIRAPKLPQVSLTISAPRSPMELAPLYLLPCRL